ncbi:MAG: phosphomannomutase, partial [Bacilli bacterium]|nr:phosphomannomutase [Bacilli bacterium]
TTDDQKFEIVNKIKEYCDSKNYQYLTIDGVKVQYPFGFALVRASNTGPNITMRFESKTEDRLKIIQEEFTKELEKYL